MKQHDERIKKMRFHAIGRCILKSLVLKSRMREKLFQKKKVNLSMVDES